MPAPELDRSVRVAARDGRAPLRTRHCSYRVTDEELFSVVDPSEVHRLVGPPGTTLFVDSTTCFHIGSRNPIVPCYQVQHAYSSRVKSDFSEIIRVLLAYPTSPADSTLGQLVCDRDWTPPPSASSS